MYVIMNGKKNKNKARVHYVNILTMKIFHTQ